MENQEAERCYRPRQSGTRHPEAKPKDLSQLWTLHSKPSHLTN